MNVFRAAGIVATIICLWLLSVIGATADEKASSPVSDPQSHVDLAKFIQMPAVRRELKLTDAQVTELTIIEQDMKSAIDGMLRKMDMLGSEERKAAIADIRKELDLSRRLCANVLSPEQRTRVQELAFQFISRGHGNGFGLLTKAMTKELEISDEQANLIRERSAAIDKQLKTRDQEMKLELEQLRIKLQKELIDSLEPSQRGKAKTLFGEFIPLGS